MFVDSTAVVFSSSNKPGKKKVVNNAEERNIPVFDHCANLGTYNQVAQVLAALIK